MYNAHVLLRPRAVVRMNKSAIRLKTPRDFRAPADIPQLFAALCLAWDFSPAHKDRLWTALARSQSPRVNSWRQQILLETYRALPAHGPLPPYATPTVIVPLLDLLVEQGLLPRPEATAMQDLMLRAVDRDGQWCEPRGRS